MGLQIIDEEYDGLNGLVSNGGEWKDGQIVLRNWYSSESGTYNTFKLLNGDSIERQQGTWEEDGWIAGMAITIRFKDYTLPGPFNTITINKTVTYVNGNILYLDSSVAAGYVNKIFPTSGQVSQMLVSTTQLPEAIEFLFNLTLNGAQTENSLIDGQVNRFVYNSVSSMAVTDVETMVQQNNKSGGMFKDVTITREANQTLSLSSIGTVTANVFTIDFKFLQWGIIQDGFDPPSYYNAADCIGPYAKIKSFAEFGNTNSMIEAINGSTQANTGDRDENFNGGVNNYGFVSMSLTDSGGNPIDKIDYSDYTDFEAIIDAPNQDTVQSIYRIGLYWLPLDTTKYQNLPTSLGENLMLNAPDVDFNHSGAPIPGPWNGYANPDGARFDFSNLQFELIGGDQLAVRGRITPLNTSDETINFFDQYPDGERRMILWVQLGDYTLTGNLSDRVNLTIYDQDNFDAPTIGVQIPTVVSETLLDHAGNDISDVTFPNTTTEDDVLYKSDFTLTENLQYEGVRAQVWAYNTSSGEGFTLEEVFFDFATQPFVAGKHEVNMTVNRGFLLAPTSDRNTITLVRKPSIDSGAQYGLELQYGYLSRWEYWLQQSNANSDFFVLGDPNNGLNKDWQHYDLYATGDWIIRISYYVRYQGVDNFNHKQVKIRPYEDTTAVDFARTFTVLSSGDNPNDLVDDELIEIEAEFTWNLGTYQDEWIELAIETKEGTRIGYMSSVLNHDGDPNNVMSPLPGETKLQVTLTAPNIAVAKCYVDTNLFSASEVSLTYRIFSMPKASDGAFPVNNTDEAFGSWGLIKLSPNSVYLDSNPCIGVYRLGDGAVQTIGFTYDGNGWLVLDTDALLDFVNEFGPDTGLAFRVYDQSGFNNHMFQNNPNYMPKIVDAGNLVVDSNGKPKIQPDGVDDFYYLTSAISNDPTLAMYTQIWVTERASGNQSVSLGSTTGSAYTMVWNAANDIVNYMGAAPQNHATGDATNGYFIMSELRNASNDIKAWKNDTALTTVTGAPQANSVDAFGVYNGGFTFFDDAWNTCILYNGDREADRPAFVNILNAYYQYF